MIPSQRKTTLYAIWEQNGGWRFCLKRADHTKYLQRHLTKVEDACDECKKTDVGQRIRIRLRGPIEVTGSGRTQPDACRFHGQRQEKYRDSGCLLRGRNIVGLPRTHWLSTILGVRFFKCCSRMHPSGPTPRPRLREGLLRLSFRKGVSTQSCLMSVFIV